MGREEGEGNKQEEKTALRCYSCGVKIPRLGEIQPENLTVAGEREEKKKRGRGSGERLRCYAGHIHTYSGGRTCFTPG